MLQFELPADPQFTEQEKLDEIFVNPGFGDYFTDHMVVADWFADQGWVNGRIQPYGDLVMAPGNAVLHYGQEVFEGLKAYRTADGAIQLFRPDANARRFQGSAKRMALPELPVEDFISAVRALVKLDSAWVPSGEEQCLYIRPFMIANENFLGVRNAQQVLFSVIASPVGAYFKDGVHPIDIWVSTELSRVATGGTGSAKCGGNYAASLAAGLEAHRNGCDQVIFVDAAEKKYIEELGGMNFMFTTKDGQLVTPELNGNILAGVTRDSILKLAPELGLTPVERAVELTEVLDGIESGEVRSMFACGTAAAVTPIGKLVLHGKAYELDSDFEDVLAIRKYLIDIQYGRREDIFGWTERI